MRWLTWFIRVLGAAGCGTLIRSARRLARRPPRIWHGPLPIHSIRYMVAADRSAGYPSRSCVVNTRQIARYDLVTAADFDRVLQSEGSSWDDLHWLALVDLLRHGDVWVAYFDGLFFSVREPRKNELTFLLLRLLGIRIIVTAHGSDIVQRMRQTTRYDWIGRMQRDYPQWSFEEQTPISLQRIEHFCRHSRLVLPADATMARLLPRNDVLFKTYPIDCSELTPSPGPAGPRVRIVHAPNHRNVKGTDFIVDAVETLRARGFDCELVLVENVARDEALRLYADADIIADQFCMGVWGQFALEGLALGKPVVCYLDHEHLGNPLFNLPVVNGVPSILGDVLAPLTAISELRVRLGQASRDAVEKYQSVPALGEVWDRLFRHVWWREPLDLRGTAHFGEERGPRSFSEDPLDVAYWPVDVTDLMPRIRAAIIQFRSGRADDSISTP